MKLPFLTQDQENELSFLRTQQADYEVDILVDAAIHLGLELEEPKALNEITLALEKVEGIVLIVNDEGKTVLEKAGLGNKPIKICNRPVLNNQIVVAIYLATEKDSYSLFGTTMVPVRVYSFEALKYELGLVKKSKPFGK